MSLYGYMWGGLIRLGYSSTTNDFRMNVSAIKNGVKRSLRVTVSEAKRSIRSGIKKRYTYKGPIPIRTKMRDLTATLTIEGPRQKLDKFRVRGGRPKYNKGRVTGPKLYAMVVRGQGGTIERGFERLNGSAWEGSEWAYFRRDSDASRLPIHMIYSLSVAQMAGHQPMPVRYIDDVIKKKMRAQLEAVL